VRTVEVRVQVDTGMPIRGHAGPADYRDERRGRQGPVFPVPVPWEAVRVRVSIEHRVPDAMAHEFLALYRAAFAPLDVLAAARQSLHDDEFLRAMQEPRMLKFVGWDGDRPAGMGFLALDLHLVPWISPAFYATRFPDHHQRSAIYYIGVVLVHPDDQGGPWYQALAEAMALKAWVDQAMVVFDCCAYNVEQFPLPATLQAIGLGLFEELEMTELDYQRYYSLWARNIHVDLTEHIWLGGGRVDLARSELEESVEVALDLTEQRVPDHQLIDLTEADQPAGRDLRP